MASGAAAVPPLIRSLSSFLAASPTPYQMCSRAATQLKEVGFTELNENDRWAEKGLVKPGGKYYYTRCASTIVAFAVGAAFEPGNGFKVVGAHTDSPVLKIKPISKKSAHGYLQVGVECYGGGLWHTWLDRDLSLAGCVIVAENDGKFVRKLVHIERPLLRVPNLCIHLQTADERSKLEVNKENHLAPIFSMVEQQLNASKSDNDTASGLDSRHAPELLHTLAEQLGCKPEAIKDFDLTLYDIQQGNTWGKANEFFSCARLDNQVHCFTGLEALMEHAKTGLESDTDVSVVACFDHEEVGSDSTHGAGSPIMAEVVQRVNECFGVNAGAELSKISLHKSFVVSADVAHAIHPNYAHKHESNHAPLLNKGTVIKLNNNQRYATSVTTGFVIRELSRMANIGVQEFVVRNDCPCGSTIGPMIAAHTGIRTVDVGISSLSMHSIRETIGVEDVENSVKLFLEFFNSFRKLDDTCQF